MTVTADHVSTIKEQIIVVLPKVWYAYQGYTQKDFKGYMELHGFNLHL